jgi:hypothetical protein
VGGRKSGCVPVSRARTPLQPLKDVENSHGVLWLLGFEQALTSLHNFCTKQRVQHVLGWRLTFHQLPELVACHNRDLVIFHSTCIKCRTSRPGPSLKETSPSDQLLKFVQNGTSFTRPRKIPEQDLERVSVLMMHMYKKLEVFTTTCNEDREVDSLAVLG